MKSGSLPITAILNIEELEDDITEILTFECFKSQITDGLEQINLSTVNFDTDTDKKQKKNLLNVLK